MFSPNECNQIILDSKKINQQFWKGTDKKYTSYAINLDNDTKWIFEKLKSFFESTTGLKIINLKKQIHFHEFQEGGKFERHSDNIVNRLFGVGVLLNENFEGADFVFYSEEEVTIEKKIGNTYIFDTKIEHEVRKNESGIRYSLLWFLDETNFKDISIKSII